MPPRRKNPKKTPAGAAAPTAGVSRLGFAQKARLENDYSTARQLIMNEFEVSRCTAERDIAQVDELLVADAERDRPMLRVIETVRLQRVAGKAENAGEFSAVASLSREVAKINGLHAPKKIEIKNTVSVSMRITSLVGVLSAAGVAALELVQREIEEARQKGLLPAVIDEADEKDPQDGGPS